MAFRQIQKMVFPRSFDSYEVRTKVNKVGNVESVLVNSADSGLPDPSVFDIETQLKSGIALQQVNTKVLGAQSEVPDYLDGLEARLETKNENNK